ncbi:MAG TPA: hydroxymethylbilane synthase [Steroidobacteraceae bacterium]|nr:hydroxymethylbilane synthase [Steroidobacteraceae bacterium]
MATRALRIGTRASALALWQANRVKDLIGTLPGAPPVELVHIKTEGDMRTDVPLWAVDGRAFFTKEIDRALLANEIDIAVHSLKDLTTAIESGITLAAVVERQDPRDALLTRTGTLLGDLPPQARVGTSSLRRRAFLARIRPDIKAMELRGNVPTRIEKLQRGEYDAIILATAGLTRLGLAHHIKTFLPLDQFTPAVSQGAIGCCTRTGDAEALRWMMPLDNVAARLETTAERALLRRIEGGCQVPLGAIGRLEGDTLTLYASVCSIDGALHVTAEGTCEPTLAAAEALGVRLAEQLIAQGASRIVESVRGPRAPVSEP